jgi:AraC family transcriptional regulator, arabinose operon regulatory protein
MIILDPAPSAIDRILIDMDNLLVGIPEGFPGQQLYRLPREALRRVRSRSFTKEYVVTDLGFFPPSREHLVQRDSGCSQWILIFVHSGSGWVRIADRREEAGAGRVILIPPGQPHSYGASHEDPWSIFWVHFEGGGAESLLPWSGFGHGVAVQECRAAEELAGWFRALLAVVGNGYHDHALLSVSTMLVNILALLHRNPLHNHRNDALSRIEAVMESMRGDLNNPRQLHEYARISSLSVPQFSHLFRRHTGMSPMAFLNELRMQRGARLLDASSLSVKAVASELGFDDPCYFSRAFRKWTGLSPENYRNR